MYTVCVCICTLYGYIYTMCLNVYMWCSFARNEIECIMHACLVHSFMHGYVGIYICMLMQRHACTNIPFPHIYTYTYTYMYVHICMLQIFYWIMKGQLKCWVYGVEILNPVIRVQTSVEPKSLKIFLKSKNIFHWN